MWSDLGCKRLHESSNMGEDGQIHHICLNAVTMYRDIYSGQSSGFSGNNVGSIAFGWNLWGKMKNGGSNQSPGSRAKNQTCRIGACGDCCIIGSSSMQSPEWVSRKFSFLILPRKRQSLTNMLEQMEDYFRNKIR